MDWTIAIATFLLGGIIGFIIKSFIPQHKNTLDVIKAAEQTKMELSQYKQDVTDCVIAHHQQLMHLTEQINKLNSQWNNTFDTLQNEETKKLPTFTTMPTTVDISANDSFEQHAIKKAYN